MKKILAFTILLYFLCGISINISAQSLKKAFKAYDEGNYSEAHSIFTSGENMNSCIGMYGEALILHTKPIQFKSTDTDLTKNRKTTDKKLSAYSKINLSEGKISEVSDKDLKSLKQWFSIEKVSGMKKEIEKYFLDLGEDDIYKEIINRLNKINSTSEFYINMETRFVDKEFKKIKSKKYITSAEKLIKEYPDNQRRKTIQRYVDSMRVAKATSIYALSEIVEKYPDNEFEDEIISKIKKYNKKNVEKIKEKGKSYQKLVVWLEFKTEEAAIDKLIEWNNYYRKYRNKSPKYCYLELTNYELNKYGLDNKYLLFEHSNYTSYDRGIKQVVDNKSNYPDSYVLDLDKGLQIFSKEKVYKKGKALDTYGAIYIKKCGKHRFSSDPAYQSMQEIIIELEEKYKHEILTTYYDSNLKIFPYDNPFPVYIDIAELPECDTEKDAIYIFFLSSYKDTYLFEVYPDKMDEALERIEYKIGFYFRD